MNDMIRTKRPLGSPWTTTDPFLVCAYHIDRYPAGNAEMGPAASLAGHNIGMDFEGKDGWRMYHGDVIPGFPRHPHRGFETITIVRQGVVDHADSLGATARFGHGDLQWMTAGRGVVHSEMFPLLNRERPNTLELFQIWLNLPAESKMVDPFFTMFWEPQLPRIAADGAKVVLYAGSLPGMAAPPSPPPSSWASRSDSDLCIAIITLAPGATWEIPPAAGNSARGLFFFRGTEVTVGGERVEGQNALDVDPARTIGLQNSGDDVVEIMVLQGRPIDEPVAHHGPFVMNTSEELQQAFADYRRTGFGGWPWESDGPTHPREQGRVAIHADGRRENPSRPETSDAGR